MCVGAFSVQLCKLNVGFGDFSPAILWIVTQFDFCYISLVLYLSDLSRQGREPCAVALELKVSSGGGGGVCLHFVIGSFSSCKVHSFMIVLKFSCVSCVHFITTVSLMKEWKRGAFVCSKRLLVSIWRAVLYHCVSFAVCTHVPLPSARWDVRLVSTACAVCHLLQTER